MNRLQSELHRLYVPRGAGPPGAQPALVAADGRVRALVLELGRPASWDALVQVWQGLQGDLDLPAPAIAVSGEGYQLWISVLEPVTAAEALVFLAALRHRYLPDIGAERIALHPAPDPSAPGGWRHVAVVPPVERTPGHWAAFVAPDLASLFADEPWVDLPSSADAQADLLSRLHSVKPADWGRALERLGMDPRPATIAVAPAPQAWPVHGASDALDPKRFLLQVMNDDSADLQLRIEAAKALLPYFEGPRPL